ncbi:hypothetical protein [Marinobacterium arenosum]|uniref:hypothetical protein n=1 Tax=Marinobacterium arenosum TaxID=2862496 RepID=UPI001C97ED2F|nr:hypothetical protein [Marinobacterium arenosum]MBY4677408.1 hypothetical protein [Marinobacterium arenosum]
MGPTGLLVIGLVATWFVCGINAAQRLDRHYRQRGDQFYNSHAMAIAEADACVFFLGPVGLLGVHLLLRSKS